MPFKREYPAGFRAGDAQCASLNHVAEYIQEEYGIKWESAYVMASRHAEAVAAGVRLASNVGFVGDEIAQREGVSKPPADDAVTQCLGELRERVEAFRAKHRGEVQSAGQAIARNHAWARNVSGALHALYGFKVFSAARERYAAGSDDFYWFNGGR